MKTAEFKTGDTVTFCAYSDQLKKSLKCKVTEVMPQDDGRIFYRLSGDVSSITSGVCIKESELFKPHEIALRWIAELKTYEKLSSEWFTTLDCYCYKLENGHEILVRTNSGLVELFDTNGNVVKSEAF